MLSTIQPSVIKTLFPNEILSSAKSSPLPMVASNKSDVTDKKNISGISSFALSMQLSEFNYTSSSTEMLYHSDDNSLALKANRSVNFNLKIEKFQFDITLSAESLGLDASMFKNSSEPLTIRLQYTQSEMMLTSDVYIKKHKTLRTPQEIIQDLVKALTTAMQDPDKRTIIYTLDDEAVQSLVQSDPQMAKLFGELVMIMNAVNLMKDQSQGTRDYTIMLSGKGKPYTEVDEEVNVEGYAKEFSVNITVLPPKIENEDPVELAAS